MHELNLQIDSQLANHLRRMATRGGCSLQDTALSLLRRQAWQTDTLARQHADAPRQGPVIRFV